MAYWITEQCTGCTACVRICPAQAIRGERKQMHVIIASACIDCGACSRVCPVDAIQNPQGFATRHVKRSLWPKPMIDPAQCVSCGVCIQSCPVSCLGWEDPGGSNGGHALPHLLQAAQCIACSICALSCPVEAITMHAPESEFSKLPGL